MLVQEVFFCALNLVFSHIFIYICAYLINSLIKEDKFMKKVMMMLFALFALILVVNIGYADAATVYDDQATNEQVSIDNLQTNEVNLEVLETTIFGSGNNYLMCRFGHTTIYNTSKNLVQSKKADLLLLDENTNHTGKNTLNNILPHEKPEKDNRMEDAKFGRHVGKL